MEPHQKAVIEQALRVFEKNPGVLHCLDCWANEANLTSPEDKRILTRYAHSLAGTGDPSKQTGDCEKCHRRDGLVYRSL
jgi:hypothetical protein